MPISFRWQNTSRFFF